MKEIQIKSALFGIIIYLCGDKVLSTYMERKELDTYLATKKRINDFCDKVIQKLEADYSYFLEPPVNFIAM